MQGAQGATASKVKERTVESQLTTVHSCLYLELLCPLTALKGNNSRLQGLMMERYPLKDKCEKTRHLRDL